MNRCLRLTMLDDYGLKLWGTCLHMIFTKPHCRYICVITQKLHHNIYILVAYANCIVICIIIQTIVFEEHKNVINKMLKIGDPMGSPMEHPLFCSAIHFYKNLFSTSGVNFTSSPLWEGILHLISHMRAFSTITVDESNSQTPCLDPSSQLLHAFCCLKPLSIQSSINISKTCRPCYQECQI